MNLYTARIYFHRAQSAVSPDQRIFFLEKYIVHLTEDQQSIWKQHSELSRAAHRLEADYKARWHCDCEEGPCDCAFQKHATSLEKKMVESMLMAAKMMYAMDRNLEKKLRHAERLLAYMKEREAA